MAEGYSFKPEDEAPKLDILAPLQSGPSFTERFFQRLRGSEMFRRKEDEDDDDEKLDGFERPKKRGFLRNLGRIFSGIVQNEPLQNGQPEARPSLFASVEKIEESPAQVSSRAESLVADRPTVHLFEVETLPESGQVDTSVYEARGTKTEADFNAPEAGTEVVAANALTELEAPEPVDTTQHLEPRHPDTPEAVQQQTTALSEADSDSLAQESVVYIDRTRRYRRYENPNNVSDDRRVEKLEKEVKILKKEAAHSVVMPPLSGGGNKLPPPIVLNTTVEALTGVRPPERTAANSIPSPTTSPERAQKIPMPEALRPVKPERRMPQPEIRRQAIEHELRVERTEQIEQKAKKEQNERATAREKVLEQEIMAEKQEDSKELVYELSHEHKDLDKQAATAWATLQKSAEATAAANALALQQAQVPVNKVKDVTKDTNKDRTNIKIAPALYKQAVFSGVVSAIVIIAVIILILLIQSK